MEKAPVRCWLGYTIPNFKHGWAVKAHPKTGKSWVLGTEIRFAHQAFSGRMYRYQWWWFITYLAAGFLLSGFGFCWP
jgi:hypothetical protein